MQTYVLPSIPIPSTTYMGISLRAIEKQKLIFVDQLVIMMRKVRYPQMNCLYSSKLVKFAVWMRCTDF
jgi:hypothetical protein